jgi:hypothetical protein
MLLYLRSRSARSQRITRLPLFLLMLRCIFPTLKDANQLVVIDKYELIEWVAYESVQQKCINYETVYFIPFVPVFIVPVTVYQK